MITRKETNDPTTQRTVCLHYRWWLLSETFQSIIKMCALSESSVKMNSTSCFKLKFPSQRKAQEIFHIHSIFLPYSLKSKITLNQWIQFKQFKQIFLKKMIFLNNNKSIFLQIFMRFSFLASETINSTPSSILGIVLNLGTQGQKGGDVWKGAQALRGEAGARTSMWEALGQRNECTQG